MTNAVEFPGLGLELTVPRVAFTIFGMPIYWYGVIIGLGMMLAVLFAFSQAKSFGVNSDRMVDVIIIGFFAAIVGGRAYYVIFSDQDYATFFDLINLRAGGIAIYGAVIGAFLGAFVGCKVRKVPMLPMFDLTAMGFLIGQCIGRWANFFNQEAFGTNTDLPWGMISPATTNYLYSVQDKLAAEGVMVDPLMPVHPTFLYESIWCALGFLLIFLYRKHRRFDGEILLFYVMWYGVGRFFIEGLRTDALMFMNTGFRSSQLLAIGSAVVALVAWFVARKRMPQPLGMRLQAEAEIETEAAGTADADEATGGTADADAQAEADAPAGDGKDD